MSKCHRCKRELFNKKQYNGYGRRCFIKTFGIEEYKYLLELRRMDKKTKKMKTLRLVKKLNNTDVILTDNSKLLSEFGL